MSEAQVAAPVYVPMDEITRMVHADESISLENMPDSYQRTNNLGHIEMDKGMVPVVVGGKTVGERPLTIADMNEGIFHYAWLSKEDKGSAAFGNGYRLVTRASPAAMADGVLIPERYWMGKNHIQKGELFYCFCKATFAKDYKDAGNKLAIERLSTFKEGESSAEIKGDSGERMGGVVTQSHTVVSVDEVSTNLPMGRGKKG